MVKITDALKAKSDQINALDLVGGDLLGTIIRVEYFHERDQKVDVYLDNNPLPWRPSKGMLRVMSYYWTDEIDCWVGKRVNLYFEKTVLWAGKPDGGIRIKGLSDIPASEEVRVKEARNKSVVYRIEKLQNVPISEKKKVTLKDEIAEKAEIYAKWCKDVQSVDKLNEAVARWNDWLTMAQKEYPEMHDIVQSSISDARTRLNDNNEQELIEC